MKLNNIYSFLFLLLSINLYSQEIEFIENSSNYNGFMMNEPILIFEEQAILRYNENHKSFQIGLFNGTDFSSVQSPIAGDLGSAKPCVYKGKVYFNYFSEDDVCYLLEMDGTNTKVFSSPNLSNISCMVVFNDDLYFWHVSNDDTYFLGKFNGDSIEVIPNPEGVEILAWDYLVFDNKIFVRGHNKNGILLCSYDGTEFTQYNNPSGEIFGINYLICPLSNISPFIYNNNVYLVMDSHPHVLSILKNDSINIIDDFSDNPEAWGINSQPFVFNNVLYFQYIMEGQDPALASYDGNVVKVYPKITERDFCGDNFFIFQNRLFFEYHTEEEDEYLTKLAYLNDNKEISFVDNPYTSCSFIPGSQLICNDKLFFSVDYSGSKLATLNENNISILVNQNNSFDYNGANDSRFVLNEKPYFTVQTGNGSSWATVNTQTNTSVREIRESSNFILFPNPTNSELKINITDRNTEYSKIIIQDISGKIMMEISLDKKSGNKEYYNIDVSDLKSGTYLVSVISETEFMCQKLIIR